MAVCPFAVNKLIPPGSNDPRISPRAVVLHVAATRALSLFDWFAYRSGGIESHFYIRLSGVIEQYRDTDWQADANLKANDFAVSIESAGLAGGRWSRAQRRSIKRLVLWLHEVHPDIPLAKIATWDGSGVGYHTQFGAPGPWTPYAKSCPGPRRIVQYNRWLVPWLARASAPQPVPPAPRPTLTMISANLWKDNPAPVMDLRVLADTHADIIGIQEGHRFLAQLRSLPGYQCFDERRSHGVQILVRNGIEVVEHGGARISHAVGSSPGRHMTWVVYKWRGHLRAHVNVHMNAGVQKDADTPRRIPRVREYIAGARVVAAKVADLQEQGYAVTVTGDLNWAFTPGRAQWWWAPRLVFGRLGLLSQFEGASNPVRPRGDRREVEYVVYDPDDIDILSQRLVPGEHSDHPWHEVTFTPKGA